MVLVLLTVFLIKDAFLVPVVSTVSSTFDTILG